MNGSDMSADLWIRLINEISGEYPDAAVLPFWRGESLLHKQFVELMEFALDRNIKIHISTNGQILKDEQDLNLSPSAFTRMSDIRTH
jgi:MoaA/NifB/PqqE/SkfB family radical SAM enzyme